MLKNASFFYLKVYNKDNGGGWNVLCLIFGYKRKGGNRKQAYLIIGLAED